MFGQSGSFSAPTCNQGSTPTADNLCSPTGGSNDLNGNLYVADLSNNRVLEYLAPFTGGAHSGTPGFSGDTTADVVFGQAGSFTANNNATTASALTQPVSVVTDTVGDVFIADFRNNRILEFNAPVGATPTANLVFGQAGSFTSANCHEDDSSQNQPRPSADTLCSPEGISLDTGNGNLFVVDGGERVLEFDDPLAGGGGTPGTPGSAGDIPPTRSLHRATSIIQAPTSSTPAESAIPGAAVPMDSTAEVSPSINNPRRTTFTSRIFSTAACSRGTTLPHSRTDRRLTRYSGSLIFSLISAISG